MKTYFLLLLLAASVAMLDSCKTTEVNCIKPGNKDQIIRWGEQSAKSGSIIGYQINTNMVISRIKKEQADTVYITHEIGQIDPLKYCDLVDMIKHEVLKSQAVNAPGEKNKFIEYANPAKNVTVFARWNVLFNTVGTKGFREIYDSLMNVVSLDVLPVKK